MLQALGDKAKSGLLAHPALQDVVRRAVNLRSDLLLQLDDRLEGLARRLNLATRKEVKVLRRQIRELENQVQGLEGQLGEERNRAERAERSLSEALKAARDAEARVKKLAAEASVAAEPEGDPEPKRATRARKKAEDTPPAS